MSAGYHNRAACRLPLAGGPAGKDNPKVMPKPFVKERTHEEGNL